MFGAVAKSGLVTCLSSQEPSGMGGGGGEGRYLNSKDPCVAEASFM